MPISTYNLQLPHFVVGLPRPIDKPGGGPAFCKSSLKPQGPQLRIDAKALSNLCNSFRSKSTLGVYVGNFALSVAEFFEQLRDCGYCLGELSFPAAGSAEDFADGHASEAAVWESVCVGLPKRSNLPRGPFAGVEG